MGKGGGSRQPTEQTVVQSNLPKYVRPYFERLLERTESESKRDYTPYTEKRLADTSEDVLSSREAVRDIAGSDIPGLRDAQLATRAGIGRAGQSFNFRPDTCRM